MELEQAASTSSSSSSFFFSNNCNGKFGRRMPPSLSMISIQSLVWVSL